MGKLLRFRRTGIAISQVQRNYFACAACELVEYCAVVSRMAVAAGGFQDIKMVI
jgi:hypothetical protein